MGICVHIVCVYLVIAQCTPIYNPVQVEGHYCKHKHEHRYKHTHILAILLLARPITILPGLPLS